MEGKNVATFQVRNEIFHSLRFLKVGLDAL